VNSLDCCLHAKSEAARPLLTRVPRKVSVCARSNAESESTSQTLSDVFEAMAAATTLESSALRDSSHAGPSEGMAPELFEDGQAGVELAVDEHPRSQRHDWRGPEQVSSTGRNKEDSVKDAEQSPLPDRPQRGMSGEATLRNQARRQVFPLLPLAFPRAHVSESLIALEQPSQKERHRSSLLSAGLPWCRRVWILVLSANC
jgi:hypothetical protein